MSEEVLTVNCCVCGATSHVFFELTGVPVCCNILWPTRTEAIASQQADLRLAFCGSCGHVHNTVFDPARLSYSARYDNSLHFSSRFQEYARQLAADLVERYSLHGKTVIEIGCGNAEFLSLLCRLGPNRGIGFDPSFIPERADLTSGEGIEIIAQEYSERYSDRYCDLLCSRHMLEHVPNPRAIVSTVHRALEKVPRAAVYFEVPNVLFTLRHNGVWDLIYEHCSYFGPQSLHRLFSDAGFHVRNVRESFAGQYLSLEAVVSDGTEYDPPPNETELLASDIASFSANYANLIADWNARFDQMRRSGQQAVLWGAGSKGTTFVNILREHHEIQYVVDINPHKQGNYISGTGQKILAPETLTEIRPDFLILMNPIYRNEVQGIVDNLGLSPQILTP
jgi:SAM-dependent methyltransferase